MRDSDQGWPRSLSSLLRAVAGPGHTDPAADLGIVIPYNTIKPLIVAFGLIVMFSGLITTHALIFVGAAILVVSLYTWLLSPLEPEHH